MQPYALVMALILLPFFRPSFNFIQLNLFLIFSLALIIFLFGEINFLSTRSFLNYMQLFLVSFVGFKVLKSERINFEFFLKLSTFIWLLTGFIQTIYDKNFLNFLVRSPRAISDTRGVTSLAPEPTFYGIILLFLILFFLQTNYKNKNYFICGCVIGIIFFAKSSMIFVFLCIMIFFYLLTHLNIRSILTAIAFFVIVPFVILEYMNETRLSFLIHEVLTQPNSIYMDLSIVDRLIHIFLSLKGFLDNNMLPNGFLNWEYYKSTQIPDLIRDGILYPEYETNDARARGGRIMSGFGAAFFELGFIAVLIPITLLRVYYLLYKKNLKKFFFFSLFVNLIMFSAIPIGFSIFAFYIGFLLYLIWKNSRDRRSYI